MVDKIKVAVGMSGGVDSSVAAYLLMEQGFDVNGVCMSLWDSGETSAARNVCYGPNEKEGIAEAQRVCKLLGIPCHIFKLAEEYGAVVPDYFKAEYLSSRTPNPCVRCNQSIKLDLLPALARCAGIEFDKFATGHYARVKQDPKTGRFLLKKGHDPPKGSVLFISYTVCPSSNCPA
ncbi:hypothetical protein HY768_10250 [candidate division TA06 bacterium]|uniref:Uncharacterized protein n=1 Tax=candidate division TA06 bacterium TaxID=2250710 RepID=A0A933MIX3_UNCT6|nr:hypothetical protein [candidate division TA06 bacterium]